jgi:hypothetical protein
MVDRLLFYKTYDYGKQTPTDYIAADEDIATADPDDKASGTTNYAP